jgi:hypothetical protein
MYVKLLASVEDWLLSTTIVNMASFFGIKK